MLVFCLLSVVVVCFGLGSVFWFCIFSSPIFIHADCARDNHDGVIPTWEFQGSVYASELKSFCEEHEMAFGDFVQISKGDRDLRFYGHLFGECAD
jgi:hypothetical protein